MKLLVLILNKVEALEPLLNRFAEIEIKGATILNSTGMARALSEEGEGSFWGSLRAMLDPDQDENKTVLTVVRDGQVMAAVAAIEEVVGDLSQPDTGILFTVPVDFVKGIPLEDEGTKV